MFKSLADRLGAVVEHVVHQEYQIGDRDFQIEIKINRRRMRRLGSAVEHIVDQMNQIGNVRSLAVTIDIGAQPRIVATELRNR